MRKVQSGESIDSRASAVSNVKRVLILIESTTDWSRFLIKGILQYSREHGPWQIFLEPQASTEQISDIKVSGAHGIIARVATPSIAERLREFRCPVVNISSIDLPGVDFPRVITNPTAKYELVYRSLRARGFKTFGYVGSLKLPYVAKEVESFEAILNARGHRLIVHDLSSERSLVDWLHNLHKPAAVVCWGPSVGHSVIDTCNLGGINIPNDVSVLGADYDELLSEASQPPQAGILMNSEKIGRITAEVLDHMMQGEMPKQKLWQVDPIRVIEKLSIDTLAVEDRRMREVMQYINENALEPINVEDVLRANPMARRSLERNFKKLFGVSIIEHIRQIRVNEVRKLLSTTDMPIGEIAERCSFSSYNYLNRVFKESTGQSPSAYRKDAKWQSQQNSTLD